MPIESLVGMVLNPGQVPCFGCDNNLKGLGGEADRKFKATCQNPACEYFNHTFVISHLQIVEHTKP